jgi:hypothetical protein
MTQFTTRPRGLLTLTDHLLTQVEQADALSLTSVTARPNSGLVVSGAEALKVIEYLQGRRYPAALLADRQRYKGKRRKLASEPFDPDWISRQRGLGLSAIIPDAGYVAEGDLVGLRSVLQRSAEIQGAVALLALANWWMYGEGLRLLQVELRETNVAVALVLEHRDDPLGVQRILQGVVTLLKTRMTMIMLRCDVSALGVIAYGALAAAYGSRTSIRHLYPLSGGGGGNGNPRESAFWPEGSALHYRDLLFDVVTASPQLSYWNCPCQVCGGQRLDRLGMSLIEEVRRHNSASLLDRHEELVGVASGDRPLWWRLHCREAELAHAVVDSGPVALACPKSLIWWQQV